MIKDIPEKVIYKIINKNSIEVIPTYMDAYSEKLGDFLRLICVDIKFKEGGEITLGRNELIDIISLSAPKKIMNKSDMAKILTLMEL